LTKFFRFEITTAFECFSSTFCLETKGGQKVNPTKAKGHLID